MLSRYQFRGSLLPRRYSQARRGMPRTRVRSFLTPKLAPQGRLRKAQGASPGNKYGNERSPEGAKQWAPILERSAYDEHSSGVETDLPAPPFQGSLQSGTLNPGLTPWAFLLDPFGVLGFAPESFPTGGTPVPRGLPV